MRKIVAIAAASAIVASGLVAGVAAASSSWTASTVAKPKGYFDFCQDKQLDTAGITAADLSGANNVNHPFGITAQIYPNGAPGTPLSTQNNYATPTFIAFVNSKSGVTITSAKTLNRQVLVAQYVEFRDTAAKQPTQIRCKLRTADSLNRAGFQKENDADSSPTAVPWGFGAGTATGPEGTCQTVNQESVTNAWSTLSESEKDAANYRPETRGSNPANVTVEPDYTRPGMTGPDWTKPWDGLVDDAGTLKVRAKGLVVSTTDSGVTSDRLRGAHYCTFVAPEYLVSVFKNQVVPPAPAAPETPVNDPDTP